MEYCSDNLATKIKKCRYNVNITQEQLAELCCVSRQAVAKWESGKSLPDVFLLRKLATIFKVSSEYLLDLDDKVEKAQPDDIIRYKILNMALREALVCDNLDEGILKFIDCIGKSTCADRCHILERVGTKDCLKTTYEWCASGVQSHVDSLLYVADDKLDIFVDSFTKKGYFFIENIEELKKISPYLHKYLQIKKIQSILILPILNNKAYFCIDNPPLSTIPQTSALLELTEHFLECLFKQRNMFRHIQLENKKLCCTHQYKELVSFGYNVLDCGITFVGDFKKIFGHTVDSRIDGWSGLKSLLYDHPECKDIIMSGYKDVFKNKECTTIEYPFNINNKVYWHRAILCPVMDSNNKITDIYGEIENITKEKEFTERNKAISQYIPGGIHICYLSDPIHWLYVSDSLCEMTGYTREEFDELVGDDYKNIIVDEDKDIFEKYSVDASETIGTISCKYRILTKYGNVIKVLDTMQVKKQQDGITYGYANVIDITELEKDINEAIKRKKEIEKSLSLDRQTGVGNLRAFRKVRYKIDKSDNIAVLSCKLKLSALANMDYEEESDLVLKLRDILKIHFSMESIYRTTADEFKVIIIGADNKYLDEIMKNFANSPSIIEIASIGYALGYGDNYAGLLMMAEKQMHEQFENDYVKYCV